MNTFRKFLPAIFLLFLVGIGIGYAIEKYVLNDDAPTVIVDVIDPSEPEENTEDAIINNEAASNTEPVVELSYCEELKSNIAGSEDFNITTNVAPSQLLTTETVISGCVYSVNNSYGGWAPFEAQVGSFSLLASDGTILDQGPLPVVSLSDWMIRAISGESLEYEQEIIFDAGEYVSGTLQLRNENASGEPSLDREVTIPVLF